MRNHLSLGLATFLSLAASAALQAQEPISDLTALLAEAVANNPEIRAAERAAEAVRARVPQAGALPDPMVGVGFMNVPITDPSLGREMMTMTRLQLEGQFPWPGKLGLQEEVARLRAEAAQWEVARVRDEVVAEVKSAYFEVYFVDRAIEVTSRNEGLIAAFAQLTSAQYGVGTGSQSDVLKAQVERTRLANQVVALHERRRSTVARLNALLARPTDTPLLAGDIPENVGAAAVLGGGEEARFVSSALSGLSQGGGPEQDPTIPSAADLQRLALEHNPMIQAHVQRVAAQEQAVSLARKAELPDFQVSIAYSRRPDFGDFVDLMVSAPLPLFAGRKQDQGVAEEAAVLAEEEARHHAMVNDLNAEIESLVAGLVRGREQILLLNEGILPQARASLPSATAAYRVGRVDFLTLLDAQVTLYQHELDYHRLLADFARDVARLERAVGTEVLR
ncbi:MAG: TolC family protein [Gemmatimonadota bacterium]